MRLAFLLFSPSFDCQITHFSALHWYDYVSLRLALTVRIRFCFAAVEEILGNTGNHSSHCPHQTQWWSRQKIEKIKWQWGHMGPMWLQTATRRTPFTMRMTKSPTHSLYFFYFRNICFSMSDWHPHKVGANKELATWLVFTSNVRTRWISLVDLKCLQL